MIPPINLYRLLCYAWDWLEGMELAGVDAGALDTVEDLLAQALLTGTRNLLRRGLDRAYVTYSDELRTPRGKLDVSMTIKRTLERSGRAACVFDELDPDVLHNRILRTTVLRLSRATTLDRGLATDLRRAADRMPGVREVAITPATFRDVHLHRNNGHYRFLLSICELVTRHLVPLGGGQANRFIDFRASSQVMGSFFEAFLRGFFRREQEHFRVHGEQVVWAVDASSTDARRRLPAMKTDICLTSGARKIVIDAKLYAEPFAVGRGGERTLHSSHLYQLLAYLQNLELNGQQRAADMGMLLYGTTGERFDLRYTLLGRAVRVRALDLAQPWDGLRADLRGLSEELRVGS